MGHGTKMINCSPEGNSSGKVKSSKNSTLKWKCFIDNNYSVATVMLEKNDCWYLGCHRTAPLLPMARTASSKITDKFCVMLQFFPCLNAFLFYCMPHRWMKNQERRHWTKFIGHLGVIYLPFVSVAARCCFFLSEQRASRTESLQSGWGPKIAAWWDCWQGLFFFHFFLPAASKRCSVGEIPSLLFQQVPVKQLTRYTLPCFVRIMRDEKVDTLNFFWENSLAVLKSFSFSKHSNNRELANTLLIYSAPSGPIWEIWNATRLQNSCDSAETIFAGKESFTIFCVAAETSLTVCLR